jgi:hypothetical protein
MSSYGVSLIKAPLENAIFAHFTLFDPFGAKFELSPEVKIDAEEFSTQ